MVGDGAFSLGTSVTWLEMERFEVYVGDRTKKLSGKDNVGRRTQGLIFGGLAKHKKKKKTLGEKIYLLLPCKHGLNGW